MASWMQSSSLAVARRRMCLLRTQLVVLVTMSAGLWAKISVGSQPFIASVLLGLATRVSCDPARTELLRLAGLVRAELWDVALRCLEAVAIIVLTFLVSHFLLLVAATRSGPSLGPGWVALPKMAETQLCEQAVEKTQDCVQEIPIQAFIFCARLGQVNLSDVTKIGPEPAPEPPWKLQLFDQSDKSNASHTRCSARRAGGAHEHRARRSTLGRRAAARVEQKEWLRHGAWVVRVAEWWYKLSLWAFGQSIWCRIWWMSLRPGRVSAVRPVPLEIPRPPYVDSRGPVPHWRPEVELDLRSGLPRHPFMYCKEVKTPEQVGALSVQQGGRSLTQLVDERWIRCVKRVPLREKRWQLGDRAVSQLLQNPENLLGAQIRVVTTFGEEIEGELFCVDIGGSNSVVLCQRLENGHVNYKWTKTNIIREVVATGIPPTGVLEELPSVDLDELEAKALQLEEEASQNAARFGVGVTEQAQDCFDALSKTMQVEWEGEDIKCMGCKISKPYDPMKSISGPNPQTVDRVRKVLQSELGRMQKKSGK
ncbi:unnamed protein product [Durusdinium trenchii]|uniref:AD domain-containing protein n=1 Tax=Durusdinium trenchii TaxID=1381693 RepID=A0ABP0KZQ5_9DINO